MILSETILVKNTPNNLTYFSNRGEVIVCGDNLIINVSDLTHGSKKRITVKCDICGFVKDLSYGKYNKNISKYGIYSCSTKCAQLKTKKTNIKKYGTEHHLQNSEIMEKLKNTVKCKYGVDNVFQCDEFKEKAIETNLERYGVEYPGKNKEIQEKTKNTNLERYGTIAPIQNEDIFNKVRKTNLERYGNEYPLQNNDIVDKMKNTNLGRYGETSPMKTNEISNKVKKTQYDKNINYYKETHNVTILSHNEDYSSFIIFCEDCCEEYEIEKTLFHNRLHHDSILCTLCNPIGSNISNREKQILKIIEENYDGEVQSNVRNVINPFELDIYLPKLKIAFEFNGLYWHSELYKEKKYHFNKTNMCLDQEIQLIHIWEDDWNMHEETIRSMILNKIGKTPNRIFARKTEVRVIKNTKISTAFQNENHIQGSVGSAIKLGLYYNDELVSLMTFGKKRKFMNSTSSEGEYELLRFCNKRYTNVIGGASKLFKYFLRNYDISEVTTYADRSYSMGNLYETLGFKYDSLTQPNYYYIVDGKRKHRFGFRKDVLVKDGFDAKMTEHEIMLSRDIYRIFNAGNYKYTYRI